MDDEEPSEDPEPESPEPESPEPESPEPSAFDDFVDRSPESAEAFFL